MEKVEKVQEGSHTSTSTSTSASHLCPQNDYVRAQINDQLSIRRIIHFSRAILRVLLSFSTDLSNGDVGARKSIEQKYVFPESALRITQLQYPFRVWSSSNPRLDCILAATDALQPRSYLRSILLLAGYPAMILGGPRKPQEVIRSPRRT